MNASLVSVKVDVVGDDVFVVVAGDVDLANADELERRLGDAISNRTQTVTVDLADVSYLDSAGIRILFRLLTRLQTAQIGLTFVAPFGSPARRVMELSGFVPVAHLDPPG